MGALQIVGDTAVPLDKKLDKLTWANKIYGTWPEPLLAVHTSARGGQGEVVFRFADDKWTQVRTAKGTVHGYATWTNGRELVLIEDSTQPRFEWLRGSGPRPRLHVGKGCGPGISRPSLHSLPNGDMIVYGSSCTALTGAAVERWADGKVTGRYDELPAPSGWVVKIQDAVLVSRDDIELFGLRVDPGARADHQPAKPYIARCDGKAWQAIDQLPQSGAILAVSRAPDGTV